ncbi:MAG: protein phosphatase 2C domain-containing protein [Saccharofermentans sp.]|nr:protein phosphatase 2C domain-containing protein [Saccharofermentans sp.]
MLSCVRSENGLRPNNEDYTKSLQIGGYKLFVIADGMGGEKKGEVASKIAVETLCDVVEETLTNNELDDSALEELFTNAYQKANKEIVQYCADNGLRESNMGTTLTAMLVKERKAYVAHIGDTRAYLKHGSALTRLTNDHVAEGNSSELTKYLGTNSYVYPDFYKYNIMYGDLIMLCSDGVYGHLTDTKIVECLKLHNKLEGCLDNLFQAAKNSGSEDNLTALLANIRP